MTNLHPAAVVDPQAQLGENVEVGPFAVIQSDVVVGDHCRIGNGAVLESGTRLGSNCTVGHYAVLGNPPQDLKFGGEKTYLEVGDHTTIREFATLNRGTTYHYKTVIGSHCFLMTYAHVAHDCIIGDRVILANAVQMGGHVEIDDDVTIGGVTALHQFVKVGRHAFVGGGLRVTKDVPPFIRAMGDPLRYGGTNHIGLSRKGFGREAILEIKRAYDLIYRSEYTMKEAAQAIQEKLRDIPEIHAILAFLQRSDRGLIRG
ncbi:MAG: acyl-ACP--UDP-N-acetylglucosamine O-acyltransferase [Calditrichia bacterium]